jgi:hypothetical protein
MSTFIKHKSREIGHILQRGTYLFEDREYNYDVFLTGLGYSIMVSNLAITWRTFIRRRLVIWPLAAIPLTYFFIFQKRYKIVKL